MSSERSYKPRYSLERIREELRACAGKQWDPTVVEAAIDWLDDCPDALSGDDDPANAPPPLRLCDGRLRWFAEPAPNEVGGSVRRTELNTP
jgi:hypothetical protein